MKPLRPLLLRFFPALAAMLLSLSVSADQTSETDFASALIPHVEELSESCPEIATLALSPQQTDRSWLGPFLLLEYSNSTMSFMTVLNFCRC